MENDKESKELINTLYQEGMITFRTQITLMIQIMTVIVLGDITIIGFAFENQSSMLMLIGTIFPIALIIITNVVKRLMIPIVKTCYDIEQKYLTNKSPKLATSFILETQKSKKDSDFYKIKFTKSVIFHYIIIAIAFGQLILSFVFYFYFDWKLI